MLLVSSATLIACDPVALKYTAEEAAYIGQFGPALQASCVWGEDSSATPQTPYANGFIDAYPNVWTLNREIRQILPPAGLEVVHGKFVEALQAEFEGNAIASVARMQATCAAYNQFRQSVNDRNFRAQTNDSYYLTFSPEAGPSVSLDSRRGFSIGQSASVPIPGVGGITLGHRESVGIHRLQIVFGEKRRVFLLDRPFEFYIPAGYAIRVQYRGGEDLTLVVETATPVAPS